MTVSPLFLALCKQSGIPEPTPEFRFHPVRKWRFDYWWDAEKLALEVQGGLFVNGRHSRGAALLKEHEKLNAAAVMGIRLLYCTPSSLCNLATIRTIQSALAPCEGV